MRAEGADTLTFVVLCAAVSEDDCSGADCENASCVIWFMQVALYLQKGTREVFADRRAEEKLYDRNIRALST